MFTIIIICIVAVFLFSLTSYLIFYCNLVCKTKIHFICYKTTRYPASICNFDTFLCTLCIQCLIICRDFFCNVFCCLRFDCYKCCTVTFFCNNSFVTDANPETLFLHAVTHNWYFHRLFCNPCWEDQILCHYFIIYAWSRCISLRSHCNKCQLVYTTSSDNSYASFILITIYCYILGCNSKYIILCLFIINDIDIAAIMFAYL